MAYVVTFRKRNKKQGELCKSVSSLVFIAILYKAILGHVEVRNNKQTTGRSKKLPIVDQYKQHCHLTI